MTFKELQNSTFVKKDIIDNNLLTYALWAIYYYEFLRLKKLSLKKCSAKINALADVLGESLVNANIEFLVAYDREMYRGYKKNIEEELEHSKKFV